MDDVVAIIMGGGRGTRLFPLTKDRSKPAVPVAGNYRLIDVVVSNCLHANLRRIFVLTQYQSESLNRHVADTYKFDPFSSGSVTIVAAEQTEESEDWFQGTADAVRQSLKHVRRDDNWKHAFILGGDQIYRMDLCAMLETHVRSKADATVAIKPVPAEQTSGFGIMKTDRDGRIVHFDEKPPRERLPGLVSRLPGRDEDVYLASMGIYVFTREALEEAVAEEKHVDFGRHVIPAMLGRSRVQAHAFDGYWEDVGTIRSYYEASLALTEPRPPFNFHDVRRPIFTHPRFLAPTRFHGVRITDALVADGCFLAENVEIERSVLGIRTRIAAGARIRRSLILGADRYETPEEIARVQGRGLPPIGIGENSVIENAIIDKDARIGRNVRITNEARTQERDEENYFIREGLVLVPKEAVIPDGTVI